MDLLSWVKNLPGDPYENIEPASSDASFRRYFRIWRNECTFIIMDAPPLKENSENIIEKKVFENGDIGYLPQQYYKFYF